MTFGGTEPKPSFRTHAEGEAEPKEDESFGWAPRADTEAPVAPGAASAPSQPNDDWVPESTRTAAAGEAAAGEELIEDDSRWRSAPSDTIAHAAAAVSLPPGEGSRLVAQCEGWLQRAVTRPEPSALMKALAAGGCNALSGGMKCVLCGPKGPRLDGVSAYYRAQTGRVVLCADRLRSEEEVAAALTHELVHAYDHCRRGLRIPFVRTIVPYALDCPTEACSEVRAYSLATYADAPAWVDKRTLVYRSALASMLMNSGSQCGDEKACATALAAVFERCAADASPFNEEGRTAQSRSSFPKMDLPPVGAS